MLDVVGARDEVDRDRVLLAGNVQRRGLAGDPDELLEVRPRDLADVEACQDGVRSRTIRTPEPVAPVAESCSTRPVEVSVPS